MLAVSAEKTVLVPKYLLRFVVGFVVLFWLLTSGGQQRMVRLGGRQFKAEVVHSEATQKQGLSDRTHLPLQNAMLFVFDKAAERCFWMKDMHFSIDIIWLNDEKQIVNIEPDVSPATYPESFCPGSPARYVLEINAGLSQRLGLKVGQQVQF